MPADLILAAPLCILAASILVLLLVGAFTNNAKMVSGLTAIAFVASALPWLSHPQSGAVFVTQSGALLSLSPFSILASLLTLGVALLSLPLASPFFVPARAHKPEYYVLLALCTLGALILINSSHFVSFYLGLELMSFPLYILAAFLRKDPHSSEAGLKYFVLGSLASGLMLYGISLLYAQTGHLGFAGIATALAYNPLVLVAMALTLVGLIFKLSTVPFHMWTPDVYQGSPLPVTAVMASLPKLAATVALVRLLAGPFAALATTWQPALAVLAALGMLAGSTLAILQTDLKRLLAWSTIAQVGFLLTGVVAASSAGAHGALFYVAVYGLTMLGTFAALLAGGATTTTQLKGLAQNRPYLAIALMVYLFSLAGIPPLAGFFAKFTVFAAAVAAGYTWLAIVAVICSAVAAFYSLWLIKLMYFDAPEHILHGAPSKALFAYSLLLAAALVVLGIFPNLIANLTFAAATAIF
ncbi:MAG TPA: NADH-quinone oxidoreductase subunit N [Alphaproteobacteria bacterium]|nr:NADH-quinone oxidoreductase subunit N [Alphaproteobacteria bacterium]